jgi:hypothetical protein
MLTSLWKGFPQTNSTKPADTPHESPSADSRRRRESCNFLLSASLGLAMHSQVVYTFEVIGGSAQADLGQLLFGQFTRSGHQLQLPRCARG